MAKTKAASKNGKKSGGQNVRNAVKPKAGGNSAPPRPGKRNTGKSARVNAGTQHPYTKLILDPCDAKLSSAPFPGRVGGQQIRVPFRTIITVPSATQTLQGTTQSNGPACTAVVCSIFPHGLQPGMQTVSIQAVPSESSQAGISTATGGPAPAGYYYQFFSPSALAQLFSISAEIRPVAACIKMGYIGPQGQNAGSFIAYEGQAQQLYAKFGSTANPTGDSSYAMALAVPLSTLALDAWTTCDTTKTVEARVNFAAADPYWQTMRSTATPAPAASAYVRGQGQLDSLSLADPDLTGLPCATVAVSGAVPGTQYLVTGAMVYEWAPSVTLGLPAPQRPLRDPKVLQTVVSQLGKYGRMLVGLVADASSGTAPGLMLDLATKAFSSLVVGGARRAQPLRIGM